MPLNSLAPGYSKIYYTVVKSTVTLTHAITLPLNITLLDGDDTFVGRKGDIDIQWKDAVAAYVAVIKPMLSSSESAFSHADLFSQAGPSDPPIWEATTVVSDLGTAGGTNVTAAQSVFTFKTQKGGLARATLLETIFGPTTHQAVSALTGTADAFCDYLLGAASAYYCRDNSFPQAGLFFTTKTNDKLRKIRYAL